MIKGIQALGLLVSAYLIAQTILQYKSGNNGVKRTVFWLSLWSVMAILFAFPSLTVLALPILTMKDAMLAIVVVGLLLAYILVYQMYQQTMRTERRLTALAQNVALHDYIKEKANNPEEDDDER
jgi:hypothetical protein